MGWVSFAQHWLYRKSGTISHSSGSLSNYQFKVMVGESSGSTGYDVHCDGKIASDFDDLRFTNGDGSTALHYWIESISGTTPNQTATVWVEFDTIGTTDTTFYIYYGNSSATASSSGTNTFIFFDDFERGNDEDAIGGSWTDASGTGKIDTAYAWNGTRSGRLYNGNNIVKNSTVDSAKSLTVYARKGDAEGVTIRWEWSATKRAVIKWEASDEGIYYVPTSGTWTSLSATATADAFHKFEFCNFNGSAYTYDVLLDDVKIGDDLEMQDATGLTGSDIYLYGRTSSEYSWYDCVYVRNWDATDPVIGSWGDEYTEREYVESCIKLVLHGDGTDDSTTIVDSSLYHHTVTSNGGAKNKVTQYKFGTGSIYLDGDAYLIIADSSNIVFGTDQFCIEAWVYPTSNPASSHYWPIWEQYTNIDEYYLFALYYDGTHLHPTFYYQTGGGSNEISAYWAIKEVSLNTWSHICVTKDGSGYTRLFVNGELDGVTPSGYTTALSNLTSDHVIGKSVTTYYTDYTNGYIDEFTITIGAAKWTDVFTPPTTPYYTSIQIPLATISYTAHIPTYANVNSVPLATIVYTPNTPSMTIQKGIPKRNIIITAYPPTAIGNKIDRDRFNINLSGSHLSLKFRNNVAGEGVYLQDIIALLSEYKRSAATSMNTKGGHISLKFQNAADEAFFLDYLNISELALYEGR